MKKTKIILPVLASAAVISLSPMSVFAAADVQSFLTQEKDSLSAEDNFQKYDIGYTAAGDENSPLFTDVDVRFNINGHFENTKVNIGDWGDYNGIIYVEGFDDEGIPVYSGSGEEFDTLDIPGEISSITMSPEQISAGNISVSDVEVSGNVFTDDTSVDAILDVSLMDEDGNLIPSQKDVSAEYSSMPDPVHAEAPKLSLDSTSLKYDESHSLTVSDIKRTIDNDESAFRAEIILPEGIVVDEIILPEFNGAAFELYLDDTLPLIDSSVVSVNSKVSKIIIKALEPGAFGQTKDMVISFRASDNENKHVEFSSRAVYGSDGNEIEVTSQALNANIEYVEIPDVPVDPIDPVDPVDPTEPVDPSPVDPADPVEPIDPVPVDPAPVTPSQPSDKEDEEVKPTIIPGDKKPSSNNKTDEEPEKIITIITVTKTGEQPETSSIESPAIPYSNVQLRGLNDTRVQMEDIETYSDGHVKVVTGTSVSAPSEKEAEALGEAVEEIAETEIAEEAMQEALMDELVPAEMEKSKAEQIAEKVNESKPIQLGIIIAVAAAAAAVVLGILFAVKKKKAGK